MSQVRGTGEPNDGRRAQKVQTYELARRLEASELSTPDRPITVNAFDPGLMAGTELGRDGQGLMRFMWYNVMPFLSRFMAVGRTTAQSGDDLTYLATAPELMLVTGKYFSADYIAREGGVLHI